MFLLPALILQDSAQAPPLPLDIFGVRLIDLAHDTKRQVIVDREPGQYLGHPTTVLLEDGRTMLCVFPKGHGKGAIIMKRSGDGGKTWSERLPVPDNWSTSLETPTIHRTVNPISGKKLLILWSGLYPARLSVSEDDGVTWTPLQPAGDWGGIVVMGSVVQTKNRHYLAWFHDDGRFFKAGGKVSPTFTLYQVESLNGGITWGSPAPIWSGSDVNLCEPGVIRSPDGSTLAMMLRENRRVKNSHIMFSTDEGKSWSPPREMPLSLTGDRHTGKYAKDGRLVVSFRDMAKGSPTYGDWVAWVGTYSDLKEGKPGQYRIRLMDNLQGSDCAYPGVECLPDGTFVLTTYGHWTAGEQPYIVSVRFRLSEIDRLARQRS